MTRETVIEEVAGGVALLTLNRPRQRNAFNNQMYDDLRAARARENETFAHRLGSAENVEAVQAFLEKRPPDFSKAGRG